MVAEINVTKNIGYGRTDKGKPVYSPSSSMRGYKNIDYGRTDGWADRCKPVYLHLL